MKALYFYRGVPISTPLMHIRFIIAALRAQGHEVVECFPAGAPEARAETAEADALVRAKAWFRAQMPRPLVNLAQLYEARKARSRVLEACQRERPDFIYERYSIFTDAGLRAARSVGCPLIQEVNAVYSAHHAHVFAPGFRALAEQSDRRLLPQADALIAVSSVVARALADLGVPEHKISVMQNAVDPAEYEGIREGRRVLRESLGLDDHFVVVVLQSLDAGPFPGELLEAFTEAWPRVRTLAPQTRVLWIGGGSRFEWFREHMVKGIAGAETEIVFVGRQAHTEVPRLLAAGDLGLMAWHRPFCSPMKVFEYMAAGLPIVAPRLDSILEVVEDSKTGMLFSPGDYAQMAGLIVRLSQDPGSAASMAEQARRYVFREHTWQENAARVIEIARAVSADGASHQ